MASEFELIAKYFTRPARRTLLGVGDDAALLRCAPGKELAVSADMLLCDRHFFADDPPESIGHKALAVNLSDMAAMGATPRWALLSLALPAPDETWLAGFAEGFFALAQAYGVSLIGGDTTRGPLAIAVTILGEVPRGAALRRSGARAGDDVWVSGTLGDAALVLAHRNHRIALRPGEVAQLSPRLHRPEPRVRLGQRLRGVASAAIDVSDGLGADLGHLVAASKVGAVIEWARLPLSPIAAAYADDPVAREAVLSGGDDYELCFTAAASQRARIRALGRRLELPLARIGTVTGEPGLLLVGRDGRVLALEPRGYDHFA